MVVGRPFFVLYRPLLIVGFGVQYSTFTPERYLTLLRRVDIKSSQHSMRLELQEA